jgi:uncharacterized membrane protein YoaK (UPF0700 family)
MDVSLHTPRAIITSRHALSWLLLAGAAGTVNGFAFLECQQFVTHVTGTATRVGLSWHRVELVAEYATILSAFIVGAIVSVVWLQGRACRGKQPNWAAPLLLVALLLAAVAVGGHVGLSYPFGSRTALDPPPFGLLSLLAFAMGLQNASVASTTGLAIRTTHLTGPATDLGIHLGTAWYAHGKQRVAALKQASLRAGKILAFMAGAGFSLPLAEQFGYLSLFAASLLVLAATGISFVPDWLPGRGAADQLLKWRIMRSGVGRCGTMSNRHGHFPPSGGN